MNPSLVMRFVVAVLLPAVVLAAGIPANPPPTSVVSSVPAAIVDGNTAFAVDLYRQLGQDGGNLCFSPYSISLALAMTCAGARGETEKQIASVMHAMQDQAQLHSALAALQVDLDGIQKKGEGSCSSPTPSGRTRIIRSRRIM